MIVPITLLMKKEFSNMVIQNNLNEVCFTCENNETVSRPQCARYVDASTGCNSNVKKVNNKTYSYTVADGVRRGIR